MLLPAGGVGVFLGPVFGPSIGHYYAENVEKARRGVYLRTGMVGGTIIAAVGTLSWTLAGLGVLGVVGYAVYDIVTAWHSAQEYNEGITANVRVTPASGPSPEQVGLSLQVQL